MALESNYSDRSWDLWYKLASNIGDIALLEPETEAWQTAVSANGGTYNATDTAAVNYFVIQTKAQGIWTLLDWVALFAGRNLNAALVPVKHTVGGAVITNNNFVEADFSPTVGLTGNGTTKDLAPGLNRNQCRAADNVQLMAFITGTGTAGTTRGLIGTTIGSSLFLVNASANVVSGRVNNGTTITSAFAPAVGVIMGNKIPTENSVISMGASETTVNQVTATAAAAITIFSLGGASYNSGPMGAASFGGGMTSQQRTNYRAILTQTMAILERPTS